MRTLLTLTALLGMVGCFGGIDQPPTTGDDDDIQDPTEPPPQSARGKQLFDSGVFPAIQAKCSSCHSQPVAGGAPTTTDFVGTAATGYQVMLEHINVHGNFSQNARILVKVAEGHYGPWDATQKGAIEGWLATELSERSGGGTDPLPVSGVEKLLQDFSSCMTEETFNAANMAQACGGQKATNNVECDNCHDNGGEAFVASRVGGPFFQRISSSRQYLQKYFAVQGVDAPNPTMDLNLELFQMVLNGEGIYLEHPRVNNGNGTPTNNGCTTAMRQFLDATVQQMVAQGGSCGPTKLVDD
jgi:hypothetical protein